MNSDQILIVEDEVNLGNTLYEYLKTQNYRCRLVGSVKDATNLFTESSFKPEIVLLDITLPDGSGMDIAKSIREKHKDIVIFFLSALNDPETRLKGLEVGADDYITKPFNLKELTLRLNRVLENMKQKEVLPETISHGNLKIWFKRFELQDGNGKILSLSQKECAILELLYERKNQAVPRNEMIELIWGENIYPSSRTIDNYIVKLRKWCESDEQGSLEIQSIRAVGYKLILKE
jgi:two-component system alkaline phosphatase synthesis response regulator PhoP